MTPKQHAKVLLILSGLIYLVYTLPTLYILFRDGFVNCTHNGGLILYIWGGIVTVITVIIDIWCIKELRKK
jgi:hypothetical protein